MIVMEYVIKFVDSIINNNSYSTIILNMHEMSWSSATDISAIVPLPNPQRHFCGGVCVGWLDGANVGLQEWPHTGRARTFGFRCNSGADGHGKRRLFKRIPVECNQLLWAFAKHQNCQYYM